MITVVSASGSTPRRPGAKMAALLDGRTIGSVGGGCAEASVIEAARQMGPGAPPAFLMVDMGDTAEDDGMVCGGRMEVLIEPLA
jgi:xanthine dehydrogenase accessory factor